MVFISRILVSALLSVGTISISSAVFAPTPAATRIAIDAEPQASVFIPAHGAAENAAQSKTGLSNMTLVTLPSVSIYSPAGDLIYEGGGEVRPQNFAIMEGMPGSVEKMQPIPGRPKLKAMLDIVPEFKARENEILNDHHYVVYAVTFKQGVVTTTEKAVDALRARGGNDLPVDTLLLRLQM